MRRTALPARPQRTGLDDSTTAAPLSRLLLVVSRGQDRRDGHAPAPRRAAAARPSLSARYGPACAIQDAAARRLPKTLTLSGPDEVTAEDWPAARTMLPEAA